MDDPGKALNDQAAGTEDTPPPDAANQLIADASPSTPVRHHSAFSEYLRSLFFGLPQALFIPTPKDVHPPRLALLLLLPLTLFAASVFIPRLWMQTSSTQIAGWLVYEFSGMFVSAAIVSAFVTERGMFMRALIAQCAIDLWVLILGWLAGLLLWLPSARQWLGWVDAQTFTNVWKYVAFFVVVAYWYAPRARRAAAGLLVCGLISIAGSWAYYQLPWMQDRASNFTAQAPQASPASEDVLFALPQQLQAALDRVRPGTRGKTDLFLIAFGGDASQNVFVREVNAVEQLFASRFDAEGRTIKLINNRGTISEHPIANVTTLSAALKRVAAQMNGDEDVLALFMTSHGSEKHEFTLSHYPLQFNKLDPAKLRAVLDESGIKHRIVVVSACFSGGFIDALKDDHTLVITAARHDRQSFGCSNEADWTYFGNAYFNQALRSTHDFIAAFDTAKQAVADREKKDGYEPSEPQIAIGEAIKPKLAELAKQLAESRAR